MASDSNCSMLISRKGIGGKRSSWDSSCRFSWLKSLRTCWKFGFKNIEPASQSFCHWKLIELSSKWFLETQVSPIAQNGCLPTWFVGFLDRENAEEILKEKEQGCFLIRVSDKAVGYVLSYRGRDRCRHFVINQSDTGSFVVRGAAEGHDTVSELIQHYKTSPIEPFGEYLTSSCFEPPADRTYDVIQHVSHTEAEKKMERNSDQPPLVPKSKITLEEVPPVPRRSRHHEADPPSNPNTMLYAQLRKKPTRNLHESQQHIRKDCFPGATARRVAGCTTLNQNSRKRRPLSVPEYSLLGLADLTSGPSFSPKTTRGPTSKKINQSRKPQSSHSTDHLNHDAIYFLASRPGSPHTAYKENTPHTPHHHSNPLYGGINTEAFGGGFSHDDIYEIIPGIEDTLA
ncbi:SH2 domain-containing protein 7-like [Vanacampus margaritifer]